MLLMDYIVCLSSVATQPVAPAPAPFFFLSSTSSILSSGMRSAYFSKRNSSISSLTSPCTTISSLPLAVFVTLEPVANFFPKSFATFLSSKPNASSPMTAVTYLRLFRSTRLMVTLEAAMVSANFGQYWKRSCAIQMAMRAGSTHEQALPLLLLPFAVSSRHPSRLVSGRLRKGSRLLLRGHLTDNRISISALS